MKRAFLLLLASAGLSLPGRAQQVPNGNLETWTSGALGDQAQHWLTLDNFLSEAANFPLATGTTTRTTDARGGSSAARLETIDVGGGVIFGGLLALGTRARENGEGLPFTGRPAALQFHYKLNGPNVAADSASAGIQLTRTVNGHREVIAEGVSYLAAAATYTPHTVPLQYFSALTPDSLHVVFASASVDRPTAGTVLHLDDIALTTTLATTHPTDDARRLALYPNPSTDGLFTLDAAQEPALLAAGFTVYDPLGRAVLTQAAAPTGAPHRRVDLRGQRPGVYTLRLATASEPVVRRLVVQ